LKLEEVRAPPWAPETVPVSVSVVVSPSGVVPIVDIVMVWVAGEPTDDGKDIDDREDEAPEGRLLVANARVVGRPVVVEPALRVAVTV